jgi:deazaflavin-dependent oxidoreductase (nitroreductase family)
MTDKAILQANDEWRRAFKRLNRFMLLWWRLGLGAWANASPKYAGQIMVLTHTGRRTGMRRRQPLNYALVDNELYCVAGFGAITDWYRNILAHPEVEVWLPDGWWQGVAEDVSESPDRLRLLRAVLIGSGFAAFAAGINPYGISDAELDRLAHDYRLIHIRRTAARTGPGGPGDLAWVWPAATLIMLILFLVRPKR